MTTAAVNGSVTPTSPPPTSPPPSAAGAKQSVVLTAEALGTLLDVAEAAEERSEGEVANLTKLLDEAKATLATSAKTTSFLRARLEELEPGETVTAIIQ